MLLDAKTKGGDPVKQPEGLDNKSVVFEEEVRITGDIQGHCPAWLLLRVQRTALFSHLKGHKTKKTRVNQ